MHPRTPDLLSALVGLADAMLRRHDLQQREDTGWFCLPAQIARDLAALPPDGERGFDATAALLCQCLEHLSAQRGLGGDAAAAAKWATLARAFLGFVRTDLANAIVRAARPATTEQTR